MRATFAILVGMVIAGSPECAIAASKFDPQTEAIIGILEDEPDQVAAAFDAGLDVSVCPKIVAGCTWEELNKFLGEKQGYNLLYWVVEFGSQRIQALFRLKGYSLPSDAGAPIQQKALLARFELVLLDAVCDSFAIEYGYTSESTAPRDGVEERCCRDLPHWWGRGHPREVAANAVPRLCSTGLRDPFGNLYHIRNAADGPGIDLRTVKLAENGLSESNETFWGIYMPKSTAGPPAK